MKAYPTQKQIKQRLLQLIYRAGGEDYRLHASKTYNPLAKHFNLNRAQRQQTLHQRRPTNKSSEPYWHNKIQAARDRLIKEGFIVPRRDSSYGYWKLTVSGIRKARDSMHSGHTARRKDTITGTKTKAVVSPPGRSKSPGDATARYLRNVQGFEIDPLVRKAIETAAVLKARRHYGRAGFQVQERGKPFDLECTRGATTLFVEVKGTQTTGTKIFLTPNEIKFAQKNLMELFIVHSMIVDNGSGGPIARGGVVQIVTPWRPDRSRLKPIIFSYTVGPQT